MRRWKTSLGLKITAVLLIAVCLTVGGLSAVGIAYGYQTGIYAGTSQNFYETNTCHSLMQMVAYNDVLLSYLYNDVPLETLEEWYGDSSSNYNYALTKLEDDGKEILLSSTITED